jgi:hypothetical protein
MFEMYDQANLSLMELDQLRIEALDLYDRCLVEHNPIQVIHFIEGQLTHTPPRIQLLRHIADDVQQRLFSLREYHFDLRGKIINTFDEIYNVDVTPLMPPDQLEAYHTVPPQTFLDYAIMQGLEIDKQEKLLLVEMIQTSRDIASQLQSDIQLTSTLHTMIQEWINALSATTARMGWQLMGLNIPADDIIH